MELFVLGLAIGGVVGAGGKRLVKGAAKAYFTVADKTQEVVEDFRRRTASAADDFEDEGDELMTESAATGSDGGAGAGRATEVRDGELNRTQAAAMLGVPVSTLRYWERRGRLTPAHREGVVCYNANDVEEARALIQGSAS